MGHAHEDTLTLRFVACSREYQQFSMNTVNTYNIHTYVYLYIYIYTSYTIYIYCTVLCWTLKSWPLNDIKFKQALGTIIETLDWKCRAIEAALSLNSNVPAAARMIKHMSATCGASTCPEDKMKNRRSCIQISYSKRCT